MILSTQNATSDVVPSETLRWRLLTGFGAPGAWNMAVDEVLLDSVIDGGEPALRFYTWQPAALSLGVNQHVGEIDRGEVERRGFSLVRRLTGGRAVLHQHELTYSIAARENDPRVSGGVIESYRKISAALVNGLRSLGAHVELSEPNRALFRAMSQERRYKDLGELEGAGHGAVCFDTSSAYELTARGLKLVGSAQARRGGALLQHGSILLDIDWGAWTGVFAYATEAGRERARRKLPERMTSLRHELGREVPPAEVCATLAESFGRLFNVEFTQGDITAGEKARAGALAREKYDSEAWTLRS